MRTAIYGAGSLGTVLGAYLTRAGVDVELVNRNRLHTEAMKRNGASVTGTVRMTVPVKAILPEEMTGRYDLVFLLTKQLHNREVATFLKPFLTENGIICVMQNGIPEPSVAEIVGEERVVGCAVTWGASLGEPGISELTSDPSDLIFSIGSMTGGITAGLLAVKEILEKMGPVEVENDLMGARWSKLLINSAFSGIGTVIGGTFGDVLDGRDSRNAALGVIKECIDVGLTAGVKFAPVRGKDLAKLCYYKNSLKRYIAGILLRVAMKKHRKPRASMLQDIEKGKKCEIDAINGLVCKYGLMLGVPTPFNDRIVDIVRRAQRGQAELRYDNMSVFKDLL